jgi:hypothetical protein
MDDPAYAAWFINFKPTGPWHSSKCDNNYNPPKCSNFYHMNEQTPGYPNGDGVCAAPACDCGVNPCGFYLFNHSSTAIVNGQSFRDWFVWGMVLLCGAELALASPALPCAALHCAALQPSARS